MTFTIKGAHILALLITVVIGIWMYGGEIEIGGQQSNANDTESTQETAEAPAEPQDAPFRVSVVEIETEERRQLVSVRGRTKAEAIIPIRAEVGGILKRRLVARGDHVVNGELVCVIEQGARIANVASAEARVAQAQGDFNSNEQLRERGFATDTQMRLQKFQLNAAKAELKQAKINLSKTEIRANATGTVQDPIAEVGDVLAQGDACITLVDSDPMFFTGQISELKIDSIASGMNATVELVTGENVKGTVTYIAPSADAQTRTFLIEIRLDPTPNPIRDGLTAEANIQLPAKQSIRISSSWVTLADTGQVGVKILDDENRVQFVPITILSRSNDGFWVAGLKEGQRVVALGQEYVLPGEIVEPVEYQLQTSEVRQ